MTIQDLGSLGELIAAIATMATLVYLALQIRQNTRAVELSALAENVDAANRAREAVFTNPELSELYLKGLSGISGLDRQERFRFGMLLENLLGSLQASYQRNVVFGMDPEAVELHQETVKQKFVHPGPREWWTRNRLRYRPVFREFVDERLESLDAERAA